MPSPVNFDRSRIIAMQPFRTILFAADFSENSKAAFRMACALAGADASRLHVIHVLEPNLVPEEPVYLGQAAIHFVNAGSDQGRHQAIQRGMAEAYVDDRATDVEYHTREGDAADEIIRTADEIGSDLIVMGTHGRTGLGRLAAGSVATSVLRRAGCPVLVVRSRAHPERSIETRSILHATDFSAGSEEALRVAFTLAKDKGARLVILHVAPSGTYFSDVSVPRDPRLGDDALEEARRRVDAPDLKYPVETRRSRGDAAHEIIGAAEDLGCDLIVMGTHGRDGLARLLMGSVAESVLLRAGCPVLAVKPPRVDSASDAEPPADSSRITIKWSATGLAIP
jgi:nucleotide-binding universal stress UspA family protein